jgi:hypothetical protein
MKAKETKTIGEMLDLYGFNPENIEIIIEQYANQRVIEELRKIRGIGITYTDDAIDKRIKELKQ